jgi:hypothetical protein
LNAFQTVLQIQIHRYGRNHPAAAASYHNLETVYAKRATGETVGDKSVAKGVPWNASKPPQDVPWMPVQKSKIHIPMRRSGFVFVAPIKTIRTGVAHGSVGVARQMMYCVRSRVGLFTDLLLYYVELV